MVGVAGEVGGPPRRPCARLRSFEELPGAQRQGVTWGGLPGVGQLQLQDAGLNGRGTAFCPEPGWELLLGGWKGEALSLCYFTVQGPVLRDPGRPLLLRLRGETKERGKWRHLPVALSLSVPLSFRVASGPHGPNHPAG